MKSITFNVKDFLPVINRAMGVANGKATLNIFNDLVIRSRNGEFAVVRASDGDVWVSQKAALVKRDDFEEVCFAVNAKDFASVLNTLSGNVVTVTVNDETNTINCSYENGSFSLPYDDASSFPSPSEGIEKLKVLKMGADRLLNAIDRTKVATSSSEVHKVINGIRFKVTDHGIDADALDMTIMSVYTDTTVDTGGSVGSFVLPSKAAAVLSKVLFDLQDDVVLSYNDRVAVFENESFKVVSRLQEGSFPDCRRVIRPSSRIVVTACRKDILSALRRVTPMSDTASQVILFSFEHGFLTLSAEDVVFSKSAKEKVRCDYDGERFVIGIKGSLLHSILSSVDYENIVMGLEGKTLAVIITPETKEEGIEHIMLIMPIDLGSRNV